MTAAVRQPEAVCRGLSLIGGVAGARLGCVVPARVTRWLTLRWTTAITCVVFVRAYAMAP